MKSIILSFLTILVFSTSFAQVGINTTSPNATLDIQASNQATPANTDGILIPKVDEYPVTNPTILQDGMLIYASGSGTVSNGFYFWENSSTSWIPFGGYHSIDDLEDGKSDVGGSDDGSSVFLGIDAGALDDATDNKNVGVGYQVLQNVVGTDATSIGQGNTAVGYRALRANTDGVNNVAIGQTALVANTTGKNNTAVGNNALNDNIGGESNVAVGISSQSKNTSGINNVAIGNQSLRHNVTGNNNTALGDYALRGSLALGSTGNAGSSSFNVAVGDNALQANESGDNNVAVGSGALKAIVSTANNTAIGHQAGNTNIGSDNVFIGYQAGQNEAGSNTLYIENTGADSDNALIYGEFDNDLVRVNGTLQISDPSTSGYALPIADGTSNQVLTTDGSGAVTWEDKAAITGSIARVELSANQTITAANTWTKLNFDTIDFDLDSDFDTTNNYFTVPDDGIYRITAMYSSTLTVNNNNTYGIRISVGGSNLQEVNYKHMSENSKIVRQVTTLAQLSAGNNIEVQARANTASTLIIDSASPRLTSFSIERVR